MDIVEGSHKSFGEDHTSGRTNEGVHFFHIIVTGTAIHFHVGAIQFFVSEVHPLLNDLESLVQKDLVYLFRILFEFGNFIGIGKVRIVTATADTFGHILQFARQT